MDSPYDCLMGSTPAGSLPHASTVSESGKLFSPALLEPDTSDPGGLTHIPQLDGVRGLAILLILFHHLLSSNPQTNSHFLAFFIAIRESMWVGVDLFFALSGFLITRILYDSLNSPHFLRNFYGRRSVRIFPLYYFALAVVWLMGLHSAMLWSGYQWVLISYLDNTSLWIGHAVPHPLVDLTGHLWSLALEEQFYLVWPLLVLLLRDRRKLMTAAIVLSVCALCLRCLMVVHGLPTAYTYKMLPFRMDGLLIGGWLALALRGSGFDKLIAKARTIFFVTAAILLAATISEHGLDWQTSRFVNSIGYTLTAIASAALIGMTLASASRTGRLFNHPWLRWFGKYSYGIYVWHMIVPFLIVEPVRAALGHITHSKLLLLLASALASAVTSVAISVVSYHAFEVHFLRLKRYFSYRNQASLNAG